MLADIANLEEYIEHSLTVSIFCSGGYFQSRNCMRELRSAVALEKPLIAVLEPEAGHGGLKVHEIEEQLTSGYRNEMGWHDITDSFDKWGFDAEPSPQDIARELLINAERIEWNRIGRHQNLVPCLSPSLI